MITAWLWEHCGSGAARKHIPPCVREARPEMIEAFLASSAKGDGSVHTHSASRLSHLGAAGPKIGPLTGARQRPALRAVGLGERVRLLRVAVRRCLG